MLVGKGAKVLDSVARLAVKKRIPFSTLCVRGRQLEMRRPVGVMEDGLTRHRAAHRRRDRLSGIGVGIENRIARGANLDAKLVAWQKCVRHELERYVNPCRRIDRHENLAVEALAISQPQRTVSDRHRLAVWENI